MKPSKYFSREEIFDLIISVLVVTLVFSYPDFSVFYIYLAAVVLGFVLHELAHKFTAMRFGCVSFFKAWPAGLLFGIVFMLGGIKLVAPGAVLIFPFRFGRWGYRTPRLTVDEEGLIAFAGPALNLIVALAFLLIGTSWATFISSVNAQLALLNLLPLPPLDGSKIIKWKVWVWLFVFVISLLIVVW